MTDLRQSANYASYMRLLGWKIEKVGNVYCHIRQLPFIGSVLKVQRPKKIDGEMLRQVRGLRKAYKVFYTIIEVEDSKQGKLLQENGYKLNNSPSLATKTVILDLKNTEKKMLAAMDKKTRYALRLAGKRGVKIKKGKDVAAFAGFWQSSAKKRGMFLPVNNLIIKMYKTFPQSSEILWACHEDVPVAGVFLVYTKNTAYYMYAASTLEGNGVAAPTLLVWESIKRAKKKGKSIFDFEGIYDERFPLKSWKGFSHFKRGFGGNEIKYPGSYKKFSLWR